MLPHQQPINPVKKAVVHGFTLVELAIAITIIGILIGGVLKGKSLIDLASAQKVIRDADGYMGACDGQTYKQIDTECFIVFQFGAQRR